MEHFMIACIDPVEARTRARARARAYGHTGIRARARKWENKRIRYTRSSNARTTTVTAIKVAGITSARRIVQFVYVTCAKATDKITVVSQAYWVYFTSLFGLSLLYISYPFIWIAEILTHPPPPYQWTIEQESDKSGLKKERKVCRKTMNNAADSLKVNEQEESSFSRSLPRSLSLSHSVEYAQENEH